MVDTLNKLIRKNKVKKEHLYKNNYEKTLIYCYDGLTDRSLYIGKIQTININNLLKIFSFRKKKVLKQ